MDSGAVPGLWKIGGTGTRMTAPLIDKDVNEDLVAKYHQITTGEHHMVDNMRRDQIKDTKGNHPLDKNGRAWATSNRYAAMVHVSIVSPGAMW